MTTLLPLITTSGYQQFLNVLKKSSDFSYMQFEDGKISKWMR